MFFAYRVDTGEFRAIASTVKVLTTALDENADVMIINSNDYKVYNSGVKASVGIRLQTKTFVTSGDRKEPVRYIWVTYKSVSALTVNVYTENSAAVRSTASLEASAVPITRRIDVKIRAKKFMVEIIDSTESATETEIHNITIEHD